MNDSGLDPADDDDDHSALSIAASCYFGGASVSESNDDPKTFAQTMISPRKKDWMKAMEEELNSLAATGTWRVIPKLPHGRRMLRSKWVFKTKRNAEE